MFTGVKSVENQVPCPSIFRCATRRAAFVGQDQFV
jgi:hypothetical protein